MYLLLHLISSDVKKSKLHEQMQKPEIVQATSSKIAPVQAKAIAITAQHYQTIAGGVK
jgi:hypothetical protein